MSTEQEKFDDLLRSKLAENDFPFNEANWDNAEKLIIEAEKKRKRRRIGFIFFIGMVLGICVMIPFIQTNTGSATQNLNDIKKNVIAAQNENDNNIKSVSEIDNKNKTGVKESNIETKQIEEKQTITSSAINVDSKEVNKVELGIKETGVKANFKSKQKQNNDSSQLVFTKTGKSTETKKQEDKSRGAKDKNSFIPQSTLEKPAIATKEGSNIIKDNKINKDNELKAPAPNNAENLSASAQNPGVLKDSSLTAGNVKKDTGLIKKDSVVKIKTDSIKLATNDTIKKFKKITMLSLDAGANYAFGWSYNSTKEAAGFNAIFGLSFSHQFAKKWGILIGIQYNSLTHLSYSSYTNNNLQYDFGYHQTKLVITPTSLYYIAVPIKLQYYFSDKNSLSIGVNALYLINTNSKVETYTQGSSDSPTYSSSTKKGYMDGFSAFDLQPAITYRRRIVGYLDLSAEVYYGLTDIKNNASFGLIKAEHNSGFKLTLSYNLLRK